MSSARDYLQDIDDDYYADRREEDQLYQLDIYEEQLAQLEWDTIDTIEACFDSLQDLADQSGEVTDEERSWINAKLYQIELLYVERLQAFLQTVRNVKNTKVEKLIRELGSIASDFHEEKDRLPETLDLLRQQFAEEELKAEQEEVVAYQAAAEEFEALAQSQAQAVTFVRDERAHLSKLDANNQSKLASKQFRLSKIEIEKDPAMAVYLQQNFFRPKVEHEPRPSRGQFQHQLIKNILLEDEQLEADLANERAQSDELDDNVSDAQMMKNM